MLRSNSSAALFTRPITISLFKSTAPIMFKYNLENRPFTIFQYSISYSLVFEKHLYPKQIKTSMQNAKMLVFCYQQTPNVPPLFLVISMVFMSLLREQCLMSVARVQIPPSPPRKKPYNRNGYRASCI